MGLAAIGQALLRGGAAVISRFTGGAAGGGAATVAPTLASRVLGSLRAIAPAVAGGAAFQGGVNLLSNGAATSAAAGGGTGRSMFLRLEDGSQILIGPSGRPARATVFIPAGTPLPQGSTVVSVSADGQLFGIRKKRRRRTFQGEIDRTKNAIQSARSLLTVCNKK